MNPPCTLPLKLRLAEPSDRAYIIETWLQSYRDSQFAKKLPDFVYWSHYGHVGLVEHMVDTGAILVAGLPDDPAWMYGWLCHDDDRVDYVFTKFEFRKKGVARSLLTADGFLTDVPLPVTHITSDFSRARGLGRGRDIRFVNPYRGEKR